MDPELTLLRLLAEPNGDNRLGRGEFYLWERLRDADAAFVTFTRRRRYQVLWSLLSRGLIFLEIGDSSPDNWSVVLTERGRAALANGVLDPDVPVPYIENLRATIPDDAAVVLTYAEEAHRSYQAQCYFSAVVMLGVASEVAMLALFESLGRYLDGLGANTFMAQLERKRMFAERFELFRRFWSSTSLPRDIKDNSDVWINAVAEIIRKHRNEAGHAITVTIDRATAHMLLAIFPEYLKKVYTVDNWLRANTPA